MKRRYRSVLVAMSTAAALSLAGASSAQVPGALWDGFVVVEGKLSKDGTAEVCRDKDATIQPSGHCMVVTVLKGERRGKPERMKLQDVLDMRLAGALPIGVKGKFIGVGPGVRHISSRSGGSYHFTDDRFVIYYKLRSVQ